MGSAWLRWRRPVDRAERPWLAFTLAGIPAHVRCCGGCATRPGHHGSWPAEASTVTVGECGG
jgi:hypothetical protein